MGRPLFHRACQLLLALATVLVTACETNLSKEPSFRSIIGKKYQTTQRTSVFYYSGEKHLFLYPLENEALSPPSGAQLYATLPKGSILQVTQVMRTASYTFVQNYFIVSVLTPDGVRLSNIDCFFISKGIERTDVPRFENYTRGAAGGAFQEPIAVEMTGQ
ncbi:hypothetical protein [Prosthecobacter sp.]|uniref:hypothetical protein n=1 Tax=Prosthecobacter sp. TaxID=1965333 RepID=UPI0037839FE7